MKLYALSISIWNADDFFAANGNPSSTEHYLFPTEEEARKFAIEETYEDDNLCNDAWLFSVDTDEILEKEILELTQYDTIEDFMECARGNLHEGEIAQWVIDADRSGGYAVECTNYDFGKSIEGAIIVVWSWQTYVGYCRKIEDLRYARHGETERLLVKKDRTFVSQVDIVMTAEEVEKSTDLESDLIDRLCGEKHWKWNNPRTVEYLIEHI